MRALGAMLVGLALLLAPPAPASAGLLAAEDATELANALAEAQAEQGVCYGWNISNNFAATPDVGSSTGGPDQPVDPSQCSKIVQLNGSIEYACDTCEYEDSANISIESNLPEPPVLDDLERLGYSADDLLGDKDDTSLFNMVNALPLLVADRGLAPYVRHEKATDVPAADVPTGSPGSDFWRNAWPGLLLSLFILLLAVTLFVRQRRPTDPRTQRA